MPAAHRPNTGPATEAAKLKAAKRAAADPVKLARATRVVHAALELARTDPQIRKLVETAPPLTPEQVERLSALLPYVTVRRAGASRVVC